MLSRVKARIAGVNIKETEEPVFEGVENSYAELNVTTENIKLLMKQAQRYESALRGTLLMVEFLSILRFDLTLCYIYVLG